MTTKTYSEKLKDPRWQKKRLEIFTRDNWTCQLCGDKETSLNLHHFEYSDGEPWEIPNSKLTTLCEHCHTCITDMKKDGFDVSPDNIEYDKFVAFKKCKNGSITFAIPMKRSIVIAVYRGDYMLGSEFGTPEAIEFISNMFQKVNSNT